jgi:hypothetical protein
VVVDQQEDQHQPDADGHPEDLLSQRLQGRLGEECGAVDQQSADCSDDERGTEKVPVDVRKGPGSFAQHRWLQWPVPAGTGGGFGN